MCFGLVVAAPLTTSAVAQAPRGEQIDQINYVTYAGIAVLVAAIIAGITLVETDESVSP